ncbi:MAG: serine/threonine-protein kinase [Acidobacteriota bacterium]
MECLGRYRIRSVLGRGAMGTVFCARDPLIDRTVAIKTINVPPGVSPEQQNDYRLRFLREARAAGKLSHPNLVTIHDVGEAEDTQALYLVMEYLDGQTLEQLLADPSSTPTEQKLKWLKQVAEALDYAHSQGIVHRDIKPANIIVTSQGQAIVTDFGIAKLDATQHTRPGETVGTPSYMSPEQVLGGEVDGRSDLFSLGIILYRMLSGERPFKGDNATSVAFQIAYQDPVRITELNPALDPRLNWILDCALAKDPVQRYQRGQEFADDLEDVICGQAPRSQTNPNRAATPDLTVRRETAATSEALRVTTASRGSPIQPLPSPQGNRIPSKDRAPGAAFYRKWKLTLALVLLIVSMGFLSYRNLGPAKTVGLQMRCVHAFRSADLAVWIDDEISYEGKLLGKVSKRLGFLKSVQGTFSYQTSMTPGKHRIRVRVASDAEGYNQTRGIAGEWESGDTATLDIEFGKGNALTLRLR